MCRLCGDRDETVNHIVSECSKIAQKEYKSMPDWVGKVIHRELCKRLKFDLADMLYTQSRICPRKFSGIPRDHPILARRPNLVLINKKEELVMW